MTRATRPPVCAPASFLQCHSNNPSLLSSERGSPADPSFWLTVKEGSPSSFKRQSYEWRDLITRGRPKLIDGTLIQIRFHNLGAGVHIFVPPVVKLTAAQAPPTTATASRPAHNANRPRLQLVLASLASEGSA